VPAARRLRKRERTGPGSSGPPGNAAVYVTWTRTQDTLNGQLTQALMPDTPDGDVETERVSFTGTVSDDAVSLRLDQGLGTSTTLTAYWTETRSRSTTRAMTAP